MKKISIPAYAQAVSSALTDAGWEAYFVGGCVRDSIMGNTPHDYDITTNAAPEQVKTALNGLRMIDTGLKHGTVTALSDGNPIEITTYRTDGKYSDNRHPDSVTFSSSLTDDLCRRDFTMNAIAYSVGEGFVDPFDGIGAISRREIVCVGSPDARFNEDGLRILRALRFSAVLGFRLKDSLLESALRNRGLIKNIARERISAELQRLLCGKNAAEILLNCAPVIFACIPELEPMYGFKQDNPYHLYDVWTHTVYALNAAPPEPVYRLALLLHDSGKPFCRTTASNGIDHYYGHGSVSENTARTVFSGLRLPSPMLEELCTLVKYHDTELRPEKKQLRRYASKFGFELLYKLITIKRADISAQALHCSSRLAELDTVEDMLREIEAENDCVSLKALAVNGDDLIELGIPVGPYIGKALNMLLDAVIAEDCRNDKAELLSLLKHRLQL